MRIAGSKAAWTTAVGRAVVVYDLMTMRELYRVPVDGPQLEHLDVQEDGKVVYAVNRTLAWASPAAPFAHTIVSSGGGLQGPRLRGDRVTCLRVKKNGARQEIFTARLGARPKLLVSGVKGSMDTDGQRVAWGSRSCRGATIKSASLSELLRKPVRDRDKCRLRLVKALRAGRAGNVRFVPNCAGFSRRCDVEVTSVRAARAYSAYGIRKNARVATLSRVEFRGSTVTVRLTGKARALLHNRSIRVRVRAVQSSDAGADEIRRGTLTIRR